MTQERVRYYDYEGNEVPIERARIMREQVTPRGIVRPPTVRAGISEAGAVDVPLAAPAKP